MEKMVVAQQPPAAGRTAADPFADAGVGGTAGGLEEMLGQIASTMGPVLLGMQFGSAAGHLAQQSLGHYALPIPRPGDGELLVVADNIVRFAEDWSLPLDQTQLWVCIRELTAHAVLTIPHVASRIGELLEGVATDSAAAQQGLLERLGGEGGDPEALQQSAVGPRIAPGRSPHAGPATHLGHPHRRHHRPGRLRRPRHRPGRRQAHRVPRGPARGLVPLPHGRRRRRAGGRCPARHWTWAVPRSTGERPSSTGWSSGPGTMPWPGCGNRHADPAHPGRDRRPGPVARADRPARSRAGWRRGPPTGHIDGAPAERARALGLRRWPSPR